MTMAMAMDTGKDTGMSMNLVTGKNSGRGMYMDNLNPQGSTSSNPTPIEQDPVYIEPGFITINGKYEVGNETVKDTRNNNLDYSQRAFGYLGI